MSLENPSLDIVSFTAFESRLTAIEAALGMTNADVLPDAAQELSSGLFIIGKNTSSTGLTKVLVFNSDKTGAAGTETTYGTFSLNGVDSSFKCFPLVSLRVRSWGTDAQKYNISPSVMLTGNSDYYRGGDTVTYRIVHRKATDGQKLDADMQFNVTLLAICSQDNV